jgi:adenylate cyclase
MWDWIMSLGSYPGESDAQRGRRRIVVGYIIFSIPPRLLFATIGLAEGRPAIAAVDYVAALLPAVALVVLALRPHWYVGIVNVLLGLILIENIIPTILLGGLVESGLLMAFGILAVIGALIALSRRAAFWWFVAYVVVLIVTTAVAESAEPIYDVEWTSADIASALVGVTIFLFAAMAYFVGQRDRFQQESDDLLHNILPAEIAARLKSDSTMIADDYDAVSVLFADVVDFTPMSADMSPTELVGLLNSVFSTFDGIVEELGLEKIKTVGDEYMVAAGVPLARPDHAHVMAELALRIRDHTDTHEFEGRRIRLRIGINSGPVTAGIVGTHKYAYDLWGDVVNTASRMESEGIPDAIQITPATHELIRDAFVCEPRGEVAVKGKGTMMTYLLVSRAPAS